MATDDESAATPDPMLFRFGAIAGKQAGSAQLKPKNSASIRMYAPFFCCFICLYSLDQPTLDSMAIKISYICIYIYMCVCMQIQDRSSLFHGSCVSPSSLLEHTRDCNSGKQTDARAVYGTDDFESDRVEMERAVNKLADRLLDRQVDNFFVCLSSSSSSSSSYLRYPICRHR